MKQWTLDREGQRPLRDRKHAWGPGSPLLTAWPGKGGLRLKEESQVMPEALPRGRRWCWETRAAKATGIHSPRRQGHTREEAREPQSCPKSWAEKQSPHARKKPSMPRERTTRMEERKPPPQQREEGCRALPISQSEKFTIHQAPEKELSCFASAV